MSQGRKSVGSRPLLKGQTGIKSFFSKSSSNGVESSRATTAEGVPTNPMPAQKVAMELDAGAEAENAAENVARVCTDQAPLDGPSKATVVGEGRGAGSVAKKVGKKKKVAMTGNKSSRAHPKRVSSQRAKMIVDSDSDEAGGDGSGSEYAVSSEGEDEEISDLVDEDDVNEEDDVDAMDEDSEDEALEAKLKRAPSAKQAKVSKAGSKGAGVAQRGARGTPIQGPASYPLSRLSAVGTPSTPQSNAGTPNVDGDRAGAFHARSEERFKFLHPDRIMDKKKRRPSDPDYDPTTLYIPPKWFEEKPKPTPAQAQWWQFKADNFDSVLFFKMGKFYELFEMDAHTGVECLGLTYMKGDQPHAGFPEAAYATNVERLVRAGKKAVVIEQVETPEQLAIRNEQRKKDKLKKIAVVKREKVAVITKATITDGEMMSGAGGEIEYIASIADHICSEHDGQDDGGKGSNRATVAITIVDVAAARVIAGQFEDDEMRSHLRAVLTALKPSEIVMPRDDAALSPASRKVVKGILRQPMVDERPVGEDEDTFFSGDVFWNMLESGSYFKSDGEMPGLLQELKADNSGRHSVLSLSLGGLLANLRRGLVDRWVFCASKFQTIEEVLGQLGRTSGDRASSQAGDRDTAPITGGCGIKTMALDGAALENLEILENAEGGVMGTLLGALDHCVTPFGKRRLREWLCKPLFVVDEIQARQGAVKDLMDGAEESAGEARRILAGLTDIERSIVRICASGIGVGSLRESRAILYEDVSKKKIKAVYATLSDIRKTIKAVKVFATSSHVRSSYLQSLIGSGSFPDIETPLEKLMSTVDWLEAERTGRIEPQEGMDEAYDMAVAQVKQAQTGLDSYLDEVRSTIPTGGKLIKLISLQKDPYVIEAPDHIKVPSTWSSVQGKKGVKRYMTDELQRLTATMALAKEEKEVAQTKILQNIMAKFAEHKTVWLEAVDRIASLDALMSLAKAAAYSDGPMCCPEFVVGDSVDASNSSCVFQATKLRHPAGISGGMGGFVPNDVHLGGDAAPFMLLTGPNMGGKSTIMRQVCLATIAAQVGAWVPADSLRLSPVDALFVRMGAKDNLILGQSTFFIELSETAAALSRATKHSLVALDELGRGTATIDGSAIAGAVLEYLARTVGCRRVFATHYHKLAEAYDAEGGKKDDKVAVMHMGCKVRSSEDAVEDIIFLYTLTEGACPKSFGTNVAKLAGLPLDVVARAASIAQKLEGGSEVQGLARAAARLLADGKAAGVRVGSLKSVQESVIKNISAV